MADTWEQIEGMLAHMLSRGFGSALLLKEAITAARAADHARIAAWRSWAQFVYLGGGKGDEFATDKEVQHRVCEAHDKETDALKARIAALEQENAALRESVHGSEIMIQSLPDANVEITIRREWLMEHPVDYASLDPGIRDVVRLLNEHNYVTTDSGDGVSKPAEWYESGEAMPFKHVVIESSPDFMVDDCHAVAELLGAGWNVEASYASFDKVAHLFARALHPREVPVSVAEALEVLAHPATVEARA